MQGRSYGRAGAETDKTALHDHRGRSPGSVLAATH
jgi:hypothetical protein